MSNPGDEFRTGGAFELLSQTLPPLGQGFVGREIGGYRLIEPLGSGGMGTVFRAAPLSEHLERQVAIKLLPPGFRGARSAEGFSREARIQSRLVHPNIAHLYDAGVGDDGWAFLVMELVEGDRIDHYCEREGLTEAERLRLILNVAEAVAFAHSNLVLHRDIKPGNVLVDQAGQPKLLDFGIAKLLGGENAAETVNAGVLTPAYASPEQIRGDAVTTASDVFQLGGLLYAVLTGESPFADESLQASFKRAVGERSALPAGIGRLSPELRAVIAKCLAQEPQERYSDVNDLCSDLRRYLSGYPVNARSPGWPLRAAKFLQRNPVASVTVGALAALLLAGNFLYLRALSESRAAAELSAEKSAAVTEFLIGLFESNDPAQASGRDLTAAEILETGARRVDDELADQPRVRAEILRAIGRIHLALGDLERSRESLAAALELQRAELGEDDPSLVESYASLALAEFGSGRNAEAAALLERALRLQRETRGEDLRYASLLAQKAGHEIAIDERYEQAVGLLNQAMAIHDRKLEPQDPARLPVLMQLLRAHERLGEFATARAYGERAVRIAEQAFGSGHERTSAPLFYLSRVLESQGQYAEAARLMRQVLDISRTVYGERDMRTGDTHLNLAHMLRMSGQVDDAIAHAESGAAVLRDALGPDHVTYSVAVAVLASAYQDAGRPAEAEPLFREALDILERGAGPEHTSTAYGLMVYGDFLAETGRFDEAVGVHGRALDIWTRVVGPGQPDSAKVELALGQDHLWAGNLAAAEALLLSALATHEEKLPADHLRLSDNLVALGGLRILQGRSEACLGPLERGLAIRQARLPAHHRSVAEAKGILGRCLMSRGDEAEGAALLGEAERTLDQLPPAATQQLRERLKSLACCGAA